MTVSVKHITVSFPGVVALDDTSFEFENGRIHAVLGANGSGKSTLVKVLTGVYHSDNGAGAEISIDEKKYADIKTPTDAYNYGIRVVHQESPLINTFSVAECISLYKGYPKNGIRVDWSKVRTNAKNLLDLYKINVSIDTLTENLSAADRNMVAMALAMGDEEETKATKILILDEADASIPEVETGDFLTHVRHIADMGIPVLMVTHRMKEVIQYCDDVSILNGGKVVYSGFKSDIDEDFIVSKMIRQHDETLNVRTDKSNQSITDIWTLLGKKNKDNKGTPILEVQDLQAKKLRGVTFTIKAGEIVGVIGNPDSGVKELPLVLGGDEEIIEGKYLIDQKQMPKHLTPRICYQAGVNVLPCDRPVRGGIMSCTISENVLMPNYIQFWNKTKLEKEMMDLSENVFDIQPPHSSNKLFGKLSGGNQQKAIMAKWLSTCPSVFVLDDPTYGVDPASRMKIFSAIRDAAKNNVALLIFSTEPEQLAGLCSRVIVLYQGQVITELKKSDNTLDRNSIAKWCYT